MDAEFCLRLVVEIWSFRGAFVDLITLFGLDWIQLCWTGKERPAASAFRSGIPAQERCSSSCICFAVFPVDSCFANCSVVRFLGEVYQRYVCCYRCTLSSKRCCRDSSRCGFLWLCRYIPHSFPAYSCLYTSASNQESAECASCTVTCTCPKSIECCSSGLHPRAWSGRVPPGSSGCLDCRRTSSASPRSHWGLNGTAEAEPLSAPSGEGIINLKGTIKGTIKGII